MWKPQDRPFASGLWVLTNTAQNRNYTEGALNAGSMGWSLIVLIAISVCLIYTAFIADIAFFKPSDSHLKLYQGERLLGTRTLTNEGDWQAITLPDNLSQNHSEITDALYRFTFQVPVDQNQPFAVYIPTIRDNVRVSLNGKWIGQSGSFSPRLAHNWSHPQLYRFTPELLQDSNTLTIELASGVGGLGYLSEVYIGKAYSLAVSWRALHFFKVSFVEISCLLLVVIGLINLYLWRLRPKDTFYLWYALAAVFWSMRGYLLVVPELPLSEELRSSLRVLTLGYGVVFVALFNFRYFGFKHKVVDWALLIYCIPAALPMLFMSNESIASYGHLVWVQGLVIIGVMISAYLLRLALVHQKRDAMVLLYSGLPLLILGVRDMLVLINRWSPDYGFLMNHATLPALIVAMWFILRRLANSLRESEELNQNLELRIQEKEHEIKESYSQQQTLLSKQVLSEERERIMRDMHDGLGGHLVGLKSLLSVRSPSLNDIKDYVELALVDLRFVINSLDTTSQNLPSLLGAMRARWQKLAASQNKSLQWDVVRTDKSYSFGPSKTLEIMRILEEAFTNALKHGAPDYIRIATGEDADNYLLWVVISNPIDAIQLTPSDSGLGLRNMASRANRIQAEINREVCDEIHSLKLELVT